MKALSVRQPWAHAILHCGKDVENRTWATNYRGLIVVHAGRAVSRQPVEVAVPDDFNPPYLLPLGALLGTVRVVGCVRDSASVWAEPGQWHWQLTEPIAFAKPIPWKGSLGLFTVPHTASLGGTR